MKEKLLYSKDRCFIFLILRLCWFSKYLIDSGESREDDLIRLSKYIIKIYKGY